MAEVRFYHLTRSNLAQALPPMLEKVLARGWRAVVQTASAANANALSESLWTYHEQAFLPHGTAAEGEAARQPIWLTDQDENPNGANTFFLTDGIFQTQHAADLTCIVFDGSDADLLAAARTAWADYKNSGHVLTYWQQTDSGWEQKQ